MKTIISVLLVLQTGLLMAQNPFAGGDGTAGNPYQISTPVQLDSVRRHLDHNDFFILINDIDLNVSPYNTGTGWVPIGKFDESYSNFFVGNFNGQGYKIQNLYINNPVTTTDLGLGLFGATKNSVIRNVCLIGVNINGYNYAGSLVGFIYSYCIINNCIIKGKVNGNTFVGGLAGFCYMSKINDSYASVDVRGSACIGGLLGHNSGSETTGSHATGNASGLDNVGGLIGKSIYSKQYKCYATGSVTGNTNLGGLIGSTYRNAMIYDYSTGTVKGSENVGGLLGEGGDTIVYCYSTSPVQGTKSVGGLVGRFELCYPAYGTIALAESYAAGQVTGTQCVGGLIGYNSYYGGACYWDISSTGQTSAIGCNDGNSQECTGLITKDMKNTGHLPNFGNFNGPWLILNNYTYPAIQGMNNAPFAFPDTLYFRRASCAVFLNNDYDYEKIHQSLVMKVDSISGGYFSNGYARFPVHAEFGDQLTLSYRVGEILNDKDTLWGNHVKSVVFYHNNSPVLKGRPDITITKNENYILTMNNVAAEDADDDTLSLIVYQGENYTLNGNILTPAAGFVGDLSVYLAVTDNIDTSDIKHLTVHVIDALNTRDNPFPELLVFPNPCTDGFTIRTGLNAVTVFLYDTNGRLVLTQEVHDTGYTDLHCLNRGIYLLKVDTRIFKIIKL